MSNYWFISTKYKQNSKLALFTVIFAFIVVMLGAYTRITNAGLSCPDWPNCYGFITAPHTASQIQDAAQKFPAMPVDTKKAWTEMTHRYFAGTEALLILALSFSLIFTRRAHDVRSKMIAIGLLILLGVQISLGAFTVTEKLRPVIVLSHLLTGLSILSVLWWAYLDIQLKDENVQPRTSSFALPFFWLAFIIVALQITLGGWVSTHYAALACIDFPYCNGQVIPPLHLDQFNTDLITIHMMHRIGAFITAIYLSFFALFLLTKPAFRAFGILVFALLLLQLTLGILNILWLRPVWIAMLHHMVAVLLLLTVITALVKASYSIGNRYGSSWST